MLISILAILFGVVFSIYKLRLFLQKRNRKDLLIHIIVSNIVILFLIPIFINECYQVDFVIYKTDLTAANILRYYASVLSFAATVIFGIIVYLQNERFKNQGNEKTYKEQLPDMSLRNTKNPWVFLKTDEYDEKMIFTETYIKEYEQKTGRNLKASEEILYAFDGYVFDMNQFKWGKHTYDELILMSRDMFLNILELVNFSPGVAYDLVLGFEYQNRKEECFFKQTIDIKEKIGLYFINNTEIPPTEEFYFYIEYNDMLTNRYRTEWTLEFIQEKGKEYTIIPQKKQHYIMNQVKKSSIL